jgi:hypothetical protein
MTKSKIVAIGACVALAFAMTTAPVALAHEGEDHGHGELKIPETAEGILQEIHKHHAQISTAVSSKNLKPIHEHAEVLTALAKALPDKVAPDKKARVQGQANNIAKVAGTLHDASDAGDQAKTEAELKRLDAALKMLDQQAK